MAIDKLTTQIVYEWGVRCFGEAHMTSTGIRALRCAEEAVELAQAAGVPEEKMHLLVNTVYMRPMGDPLQEAGGVLLTVIAYCHGVLKQDPNDVFATELLRCLSKTPEEFAKRNQDKLRMGLNS